MNRLIITIFPVYTKDVLFQRLIGLWLFGSTCYSLFIIIEFKILKHLYFLKTNISFSIMFYIFFLFLFNSFLYSHTTKIKNPGVREEFVKLFRTCWTNLPCNRSLPTETELEKCKKLKIYFKIAHESEHPSKKGSSIPIKPIFLLKIL